MLGMGLIYKALGQLRRYELLPVTRSFKIASLLPCVNLLLLYNTVACRILCTSILAVAGQSRARLVDIAEQALYF